VNARVIGTPPEAEATLAQTPCDNGDLRRVGLTRPTARPGNESSAGFRVWLGFCGPSRDRVYGLNTRILRSRIGLKCFALLVQSVNPCSAAVAATRASPARRPCERAYSSMYTAAR